MNRAKASFLTAATALALLTAGCSGAGGAPDPVGQGTGQANSSLPSDAPPPSDIETTAPEGGAAVRLGDTEEAITKVGCTPINDTWTVSGSNEGGAKVAVTTSEDRQTVLSASVVFDDGKLVDMKDGQGSATIAWEGESFVVSGTGPFMDLAAAEAAEEQINFVIKGSCPAE